MKGCHRRETTQRIPIGLAIKEFREIRDLSQNKLERKAHRGGGYISMVERGELMPTLDRIDEIAYALGVETWLLVQRACELRVGTA